MDLPRLARRRATDEVYEALRNAILQHSFRPGKVPAERVFLLAPKLSAEGIKDKGKPTRVDFSLK